MGTWGYGALENDIASDTAGDVLKPIEDRLQQAAKHWAKRARPPDVADYQTYRSLIELLVGAHQVGAYVSEGAWYSAAYLLELMTRDEAIVPALVKITRRRLKWLDQRVAGSKNAGWRPKRLAKLKFPAWAKKR